MKKTFIKIIASLFLVSFATSALYAQDDDFVQPFKLHPVTDGIIGGTSIALTGSAFLCDNVFHIKENNIENQHFPLVKTDVNPFDRTFMKPYSKPLDTTGDVVLGLTLLSPAIMFTNKNTDWLTISIMYMETIALANGIKEWGKLLINRPRPYMYFDDYPQEEVKKGDWHNSMPSGHTTMAFAGAAFTSCIFNEYFPDSVWRHVVTAASFGIATSVGIIRMASGNHFATDVITGAFIGTLCGFAVPFFHSRTFDNLVNRNKNMKVEASPLGFNVAIKL